MNNPASNTLSSLRTLASRVLGMGLFLGLGLAASQSALAHGNVSLNIGGVVAPGVYGSISVGRPYYPPQVVYQQPQIVYQQPQVIYQQPQVVYQAPIVVNQPAYVVRQPAPVIVAPGYYGNPGYGYGHHRHHGHHGQHRGWY
jgi:hypothetical protein